MSRTQKAERRRSTDLSPFGSMLEDALRHYLDARWLGEQSPLASPYLLYDYLEPDERLAEARGAALQRLLRQAAEQVDDPKYGARYRQILTEYYFEDRSQQELLDRVNLARNTFHANRKKALAGLESVVIDLINPAIRREAPPDPFRLFGRSKELSQCWLTLEQSQSVAVYGSSGIGKTSVGGYLANRWSRDKTFWFTIRAGINDQVENFVFALGLFLHHCGESALWQELGAEVRRLNVERDVYRLNLEHVLAIIRRAFRQLAARDNTPLLCIDQVDHLQPDIEAHRQLRQFIESLRGLVPLVTMGLTPVIEASFFCELGGLSVDDSKLLLEAENVYLSVDEQVSLHDFTRGNPRLLELFVSAYTHNSMTVASLAEMADMPPVQFLFDRIWGRLGREEQILLSELSVYRNPAPAEEWQKGETTASLNRLQELQLVEADSRGGVQVLPVYRASIVRSLTDRTHKALHAYAADVRATRGAYTAAAYHWIQAGDLAQAILIWHEHRQQEINQGQAGVALRMMRNLLTMSLSTEAREMLGLLCAELERWTGQGAKAQQILDSVNWQTPIRMVDAGILTGSLANDQSDFPDAERAFRQALATAEQLIEARLAHIHKGLGWTYMRQRDLDAAWEEAQLARYEAVNFLGVLLEMRYEYEEAREYYQSALDLAETMEHTAGSAKTSINLARLYTQLGRFEEAKVYCRRAEDDYRKIGKAVAVLSSKINWALILNLAGEHEEALEVLMATHEQFGEQELPLPPWQFGLIFQGMAEAHLGLANLDMAKECVYKAITSKEKEIRPDAYRTLGEIMLQQGRGREAERYVRKSLRLIQENDPPDLYLAGYAWRALAQVARANKDWEIAHTAKQEAIQCFQSIRLDNEIETTHRLLPNL